MSKDELEEVEYVMAAEVAAALVKLVLHLVDYETAKSLLHQEAVEQANEEADEAEKRKFGADN